MGTAPDARQHPAMPSPGQVVEKSVSHMTRQGLTRQLALITVSAVAQQAKRNLESVGIDGLDWLQEISDAAECRLPAPAPTVTDQEGSEHGNGSSS